MTLQVDVTHDVVDYLTAAGTVGAALLAAFAVRQSGRQGRQQRQAFLDEQARDSAERRADFELQLLLELAQLVQVDPRSVLMGFSSDGHGLARARALLLALPVDLLPVLRSATGERSESGRDRDHPALVAIPNDSHWLWRVQELIGKELSTAIAAGVNLPPVSDELAITPRRRFRRPRR